MARKKKDSAKGRRAALKSFAKGRAGRADGAFSPAYLSDKRELVFGDGRNFKIGSDGYANTAAGISAASSAGYDFIYLNGDLWGTAGGGRLATKTSTAGTTLSLTVSEPLSPAL